MTTPLAAVLATMQTDFESADAPADGSRVPYKMIKGPSLEGGKGQHRQFYFELKDGDDISFLDATGSTITALNWPLELHLFIHRGNQPALTYLLNQAEDIKTFVRKWATRPDGGYGVSGIRNVILRRARIQSAQEKVSFLFDVKTEESDSP